MVNPLLAFLFVLAMSSSVFADLSAVRAAFDRGDDKSAISELDDLARGGDMAAQDFLGDAYFTGRGVEKNFSMAWHWYKRAAVQDNAESQYKLGYMYQHGLGVGLDPKEARKWYAFAADKGLTAAQVKLGLIYFFEGGLRREESIDMLKEAAVHGVPRGVMLMRDAASQGSLKARKVLAEISAKAGCRPVSMPPGMSKSAAAGYNAFIDGDYETALGVFKPLSDRGDPGGLFGMGLFYYSGKGISQDIDKALRKYRSAAKRGNARARLMLERVLKLPPRTIPEVRMAMRALSADLPALVGRMEKQVLRSGTAFGMTLPPLDKIAGQSVNAFANRNFEKAFTGFKLLGDKGDPAGDYGMALMYQYGRGFKQDIAKSIWFYRAAADAGYVPARVNLGAMYYLGKGGRRDYRKAMKWLQIAVDKGYPSAENMAGLMYFLGYGVEKDMKMALKLFRLAAEQDSAEAANNLGVALFGVQAVARARKSGTGDKTRFIHLNMVAGGGYGVAADGLRETVFAYDDKGKARPGYREAMKWLQIAAVKGNASARANLGRIYKAGFPISRNLVKSYKWLSLAVNSCDKAADKELIQLAGKMSRGDIALAEWQILKEMKNAPKKTSQLSEVVGKVAGTPKEMTAMGIRYQFGRGVPRDYRKAVRYYMVAANKGYPKAQHNLAYMYRKGFGVARDMKQAAKWYRKAAEQGDVFSQKSLGIMYQFGYGVPQDDLEAVKWYRKAAKQGNPKAQHNLAYMYKKGRGVSRDMELAFGWYLKAAEQGHRRAEKSVGIMYQFGQGVTKNYSEAAKWYLKAAGQGDVKSQGNLAFLYESGLGVSQDYEEAAKWYRKAAVKDNARAQASLGFLYFKGLGVEKNSVEAIKWTSLAIAKKDSRAYKNLYAMLKEDGFGTSQEYRKLARTFLVREQQKSADVLNALGLMYQYGKGVEKDKGEAKKWFELAINKGSARAKKNIEELTRKKGFF